MISDTQTTLRVIYALSLSQPWASLMAQGQKRIETRSWPAGYKGPVAIHAAKRFDRACRALCEQEPFRSCLLRDPQLDPNQPLAPQLPRGQVLALARLDRCEQVTQKTTLPVEPERSFGNYTWGRYLFHVTHLHPLVDPFEATGSLGLWPLEVPEALLSLLPELGEASHLLSREQVPTLIVRRAKASGQDLSRGQHTSQLQTEVPGPTGLIHLHRMAHILHLEQAWFREMGASGYYLLTSERKRAQAILHGAIPE